MRNLCRNHQSPLAPPPPLSPPPPEKPLSSDESSGIDRSYQEYLAFKQDLQNLVNDIGIEIRVAHYPSYCSKYNPIERRFFPHVGRACQGMLFDTLDTVVRLMKKTSTTTGLRATVNVIRRVYETGRKVAAHFKKTMTILFDGILPRWNYRAVPQ